MKKILLVLATLALSLTAFAQKPEEIVSKMEEQMALHEGEGLIWTMDLKLPLLGTFTSNIRSLGKKHTVIFSSHVLSEISATCDRIIVISEGRLVADSKADELSKALADTQKLSLTVEGSPSDVLGEIKKIPGVKKYMKVRELGEKSAVYSVEYGNEFDIRREVFSAMARINAPILEMKSGNESLEDMFLKLTQGAGKAGR